MTKEERISALANLRYVKSWKDKKGLADETINTCIKALEQEPCEDWYDVPSDEMTLEQARQAVKDLRKKLAEYLEKNPCGDAISRQAVEKITWEEPSYTDALNVLTEVRDKVRALPPVTPQPKTGHWIGDKAYPICPKCNCNIIEEYISCSDYAEMYKPMKYCPNCGAKMESEDKI